MNQVFLADPLLEERSAFRALLLDMQMEIAGEAVDWSALYSQAGSTHPDMILLSWDLLPKDASQAVALLRKDCPDASIVAIINQAGDNHDAIQSSGVDACISKEDFPHTTDGNFS